MKTFSAGVLSYLQRRNGIVLKSLLWVRGRNCTTGVEEPMGVWTGDQDLVFTIGGVARTYAGEGAMLPIESTSCAPGSMCGCNGSC